MKSVNIIVISIICSVVIPSEDNGVKSIRLPKSLPNAFINTKFKRGKCKLQYASKNVRKKHLILFYTITLAHGSVCIWKICQWPGYF